MPSLSRHWSIMYLAELFYIKPVEALFIFCTNAEQPLDKLGVTVTI